jgi:hypothetical protein
LTIPPPPGRQFYLQDEHGRPCDDRPEDCHLWCWSGAERWLYASEHPLPPEVMRGRVKKDKGEATASKQPQATPQPERRFW